MAAGTDRYAAGLRVPLHTNSSDQESIVSRRQPAPAQDMRADRGLAGAGDVEKAGAERGAEPLVAAGGVEVAIKLCDIERQLGDGVRPVDGDGDAALARPAGRFRRRAKSRRWAT